MNHRELANALAALPEGSVGALVAAAENIRKAEEALAGFTGKKPRKKRGPNKPKPAATSTEAAVTAVKKSHHKKVAKPLSSALDRLAAKRVSSGIKTRKPPVEQEDED